MAKIITMTFDDKKLKRGFVNIEKANLIATRNTLNTMAGLTRKNAIRNIKSDFINRNQFTENNILYKTATGKSINKMESRAGATNKADYMELQETGGIRKPKLSKNLAIPTDKARGGSKSRVVSKPNYLTVIKSKLVKGPYKKNYVSKKARMVAMAYVAKRENKFMNIKKGIYITTSFRKGSKFVKYKKDLIYNTRLKNTYVKQTKWLEPATIKPIQDGQNIYNSQINKLLKKDII